jgi:hypothetical protein
MTTPHPDDIVAHIQATYPKPLTESQLRGFAQCLIAVGAKYPGTLSEERKARLLQHFPDLIVPSLLREMAVRPKKPRASNRR